ncbi:MAG: hypothetical protein WA941_01765 [Nitrososphaeraceae archaeon]
MKNPNDIVRANSVSNLSFLINSISNLKDYINNSSYHVDNLKTIKENISTSKTKIVEPEDFEKIDNATRDLFSKTLAKRCFRQHENLSDKLETLWNILQEIYENDPTQVVVCVVNMIEKKIPNNLTPDEKIKFRNDLLSKFLGTSNKVNIVTDSIFNGIKKDLENKRYDELTICGMLLSFVLNSQTHLYFAMESVREAVTKLGKDYDLEEIFSIESPVQQNTKRATDIRAIRNAVSHGSFNIENQSKIKDFIIGFQSVFTNYTFNKQYTGKQLLNIYSAYDNLRNFQELLIRIALLKATLKIFFVRPQQEDQSKRPILSSLSSINIKECILSMVSVVVLPVA